jgi:hypothetical protein
VEDLAIVDGRDKSVSNGADGFIKVCLSGECIESSLRGKWWILGCNSDLDRVEWDRKWRGNRAHLVRGFVECIDRVVGHRGDWERVGEWDCKVKICVGMELQVGRWVRGRFIAQVIRITFILSSGCFA